MQERHRTADVEASVLERSKNELVDVEERLNITGRGLGFR